MCSVVVSAHGELRVLPGDVALHHAGTSHQTVVGQVIGDQWRSDLTAQATFSSSDTAVATVDAAGTIRAVANGQTIITATVNGETARRKNVRVNIKR